MNLSIPGVGGRVPTWQRQRPQQQPSDSGSSGAPVPEMDWVDSVSTTVAAGEMVRGQVAAVNQAIQATEEGLALVTAARHGLEAVYYRLGRMAAVLGRVSSGPGPVNPETWSEVQSALRADAQAIDQLAAGTRCGGSTLLDGSFGTRAAAFGAWLELVSVGPGVRSSPPEGFTVILTQEPTRATILGTRALTAALISSGEVLEADLAGRRAAVTTRAGQTVADVAAAFQAEFDVLGLPVCALAASGERLLVHHRRYGRLWRFRVRSRTAGILSPHAGQWIEVANGRDVAGTLHGEPAEGEGQVLKGSPGNRYTADLAIRYTGTPPPGFEPAEARGRGKGAAPRDGWKDGTLEAGRVLVVQRSLRLHARATGGVSLKLDSMRCADLGWAPALAPSLESVAAVLLAKPEQAADALAVIERAREQVNRVLQEAGRIERDELTVHLNCLRIEAQNVIASQGLAGAPLEIGAWMVEVSKGLRERGPEALALQQCPRPTALLKLLGAGPEGALPSE